MFEKLFEGLYVNDADIEMTAVEGLSELANHSDNKVEGRPCLFL